ncbi:hypothetical protein SAY87_006350 [Trapa incisa]|uniref:Uncharacterized protein n=1 Tax=Trapa incisa TaxID=236973 RepID=A0AAN7JWF8_9MYRT|nr:hypothetical protein SAY87_006350 [Trapa incisa]
MNCRIVFSDHSRCYVHPSLQLVGVCPLCLNDRLVFLAAAMRSRRHRFLCLFSSCASGRGHRGRGRSSILGSKKKTTFGKFLAIGSLVKRQNWTADALEDSGDATSSLEDDSFISIKFEDNGQASWEKNKVSKVSLGSKCSSIPWNGHLDVFGKTLHPMKDPKTTGTAKIVLKHSKPRWWWPSRLMWRKRIGHLLHLIRLNRRSGKAEGAKV